MLKNHASNSQEGNNNLLNFIDNHTQADLFAEPFYISFHISSVLT